MNRHDVLLIIVAEIYKGQTDMYYQGEYQILSESSYHVINVLLGLYKTKSLLIL